VVVLVKTLTFQRATQLVVLVVALTTQAQGLVTKVVILQ
jgi:hypothetical protein